MSTVISKLTEMKAYILEKCNDCNFSDYQFGFVKERGTNIAISLAHDVSMYCKDKKSPVFLCGLDAEGAFDSIAHPVPFNKCRHVVPDSCWKLLYNWFSDISRIKWYTLGKDIQICKGTKQDGLTSSFLFNIFIWEQVYVNKG